MNVVFYELVYYERAYYEHVCCQRGLFRVVCYEWSVVSFPRSK